MQRVRTSWAAVSAVIALAVLGCGDRKVKVSGVVTLDGQPVEGAMVTFIPVDAGKSQNATGTADKDGVFQLTTTKPNDGASPGEYKVTVVYVEGAVPPPNAGGMKQAFEGFEKAQKQKRPPPKFMIPPKYSDPGKTELKQKVPPEGQVILDLKSK